VALQAAEVAVLPVPVAPTMKRKKAVPVAEADYAARSLRVTPFDRTTF
jgi:hypothetical protein